MRRSGAITRRPAVRLVPEHAADATLGGAVRRCRSGAMLRSLSWTAPFPSLRVGPTTLHPHRPTCQAPPCRCRAGRRFSEPRIRACGCVTQACGASCERIAGLNAGARSARAGPSRPASCPLCVFIGQVRTRVGDHRAARVMRGFQRARERGGGPARGRRPSFTRQAHFSPTPHPLVSSGHPSPHASRPPSGTCMHCLPLSLTGYAGLAPDSPGVDRHGPHMAHIWAPEAWLSATM